MELEEFKNVSGLVPSIPKSTTFFCNVPNALKATILNSMPFAKGTLLVRYIGVPLLSSRLPYRECKVLVEKLEGRINDWHNKIFWDVPCSSDLSWGWRKLLQIRPMIRPFIWSKVNTRKSNSMCFDNWHDLCPIRGMLTVRDIVRYGFGLSDSVSDIIINGNWRWPSDWHSRFSVLNID
ncbi:hypothetical protein Tco_0344178 [Tanacetum coccineum]